MASSSLLKAATADLLERTRSRRELAMSVLRGSVAIATLTAGFTFSTLLGQTFTPQHVFRAEQVELLLALTFLFSCMSVLFAGYVIIFVKVRQNAISLRLYLPKSDKRYQDAQIKAARLSTYELALSFAVMVVNSAAFVTMGLAIMAFQKVVGGLIVAVTAQTSLSLLLISCHLFLEASYNSPDLFNKFADPSEADPDPEDDVPPTIDGNSVGFATASGAKIAVDQKDNNSGNQENTATTNEKMAHMV